MDKRVVVILIAVIIVALAVGLYVKQRHGGALAPESVIKGVAKKFKLESPAYRYGESIPSKYALKACGGLDVSPPLIWSGFTKTGGVFVLIMYDPDAPKGVFYHWVVYNIPENVNKLPEALPKWSVLPGIGLQGTNDYGFVGYGGPCPPHSEKHRYIILLLHVDKPLDLKPGAKARDVLKAVKGHVLEYAELLGYYP